MAAAASPSALIERLRQRAARREISRARPPSRPRYVRRDAGRAKARCAHRAARAAARRARSRSAISCSCAASGATPCATSSSRSRRGSRARASAARAWLRAAGPRTRCSAACRPGPEHVPPLALLDAELLTGRTHQIRVHLTHLGFPLAGDDKYGDFAWNRAPREGRAQADVPACAPHPVRASGGRPGDRGRLAAAPRISRVRRATRRGGVGRCRWLTLPGRGDSGSSSSTGTERSPIRPR